MIVKRNCPVCHSPTSASREFLRENIDPSKLGKYSFASRKSPEYMCHNLVRCARCSLVYADSPPPETELAHAYHVAEYDSADEANDAASAYILAIRTTLERLIRKGSALEIGTGTGVFLEHLMLAGFPSVIGVEPSSAAIAAAPEQRRAWIREGMFDERDFAPESFDLICCFMTMEHVRDPLEITRAAYRLLRPGGAFVTVTHDYQSVVNRLLGKRSPIIDIEHLQLFSKPSLRYLFESIGFADVETYGFKNRYSLRYWTRLAPVPSTLKPLVLRLLQRMKLDHIKLGLNVGNVLTCGFKKSE